MAVCTRHENVLCQKNKKDYIKTSFKVLHFWCVPYCPIKLLLGGAASRFVSETF